jgi:hypothetical protein
VRRARSAVSLVVPALVLRLLSMPKTTPRAADGHLTVCPYPLPLPLASSLNFSAGETIANGVVVPICDTATTDCTPGDFTVTMGPASADIVIDVHRLPPADPMTELPGWLAWAGSVDRQTVPTTLRAASNLGCGHPFRGIGRSRSEGSSPTDSIAVDAPEPNAAVKRRGRIQSTAF